MMISSSKPWVFLSAFRNEAQTLPLYLEEMYQVLGKMNLLPDSCLVLIDDYSLDSSIQAIDDWKEKNPELEVVVLSPMTNLGNQGALAWGLSELNLTEPLDQWVFSMDPDGEDDLSSLPEMIRLAKDEPEKVIYSVRTVRHDSLKVKLLYKPFKWLYRTMTSKDILPNNFMILPARYQKAVALSPFTPVYYSLATLRLNLPWLSNPSPRRHRYGGQSTQNVYNLITHALVGLMIFHETVTARGYIYITGAGSFFMFLNSFGLFVKFIQNKPVPDGFASTFMSINFGFAMMLIAMLGFTAAISMGLKLAAYYLTRWNIALHQKNQIS